MPFYVSSPQSRGAVEVPDSCHCLLLSVSPTSDKLEAVMWFLTELLICISLSINDVKHLFLCPLYVLFYKVSVYDPLLTFYYMCIVLYIFMWDYLSVIVGHATAHFWCQRTTPGVRFCLQFCLGQSLLLSATRKLAWDSPVSVSHLAIEPMGPRIQSFSPSFTGSGFQSPCCMMITSSTGTCLLPTWLISKVGSFKYSNVGCSAVSVNESSHIQRWLRKSTSPSDIRAKTIFSYSVYFVACFSSFLVVSFDVVLGFNEMLFIDLFLPGLFLGGSPC